MTATDTALTQPTATAGGPMLVGAHAHGPDGARTGAPPERFTSTDPDAFPVPTGREEEWRFTPLRPLRPLFQPFTATGALSGEVVAPDGVEHGPLSMRDALVGRVLSPADRVSALALRGSDHALTVRVAAGATLDEPIVMRLVGEVGTSYSHLVVDAGANARATIVVDYTGSVTLAENVEIIVGAGAVLDVISVHDWAQDAVQVATHTALVGTDATLRHASVTLGGRVVRIAPTVRFGGSGGHAELLGLSFAGAGQHQESRLYVDHNQPDCTSDVLYKNALQGEGARTVWIGDVRIRPGATGTKTFEMNRNLVLTDGARADSVPNLEIETGEIAGAGHASATGRFDDLQLFYLESRGIPEDVARRLVVRGFFAEVVQRINVPALQDRLMTSIEARLGALDGDTRAGGDAA
ncbi:MAG: Fe-S cluster assembly protein SufD [Actinomycetota bacterium]